MAWEPDRNDIIGRALRILRVVSVGNSPTAVQYSHGADALNSILEHYNNNGFRFELMGTETITLTGSDNPITLATDLSDVLVAYIDRSTGDTDYPVLDIIDYSRYYEIVDKTTTGTPQCLYIEYGSAPTGYLYPESSSASDTLKIIYTKKITSVDSSSAEVDLEKRALRSLIFRLASDLSYEYLSDTGKIDRLELKATQLEKEVLQFEVRKGDYFIAEGYA